LGLRARAWITALDLHLSAGGAIGGQAGRGSAGRDRIAGQYRWGGPSWHTHCSRRGVEQRCGIGAALVAGGRHRAAVPSRTSWITFTWFAETRMFIARVPSRTAPPTVMGQRSMNASRSNGHCRGPGSRRVGVATARCRGAPHYKQQTMTECAHDRPRVGLLLFGGHGACGRADARGGRGRGLGCTGRAL